MNTIRGKPKAGADPLQIQENNKSELSPWQGSGSLLPQHTQGALLFLCITHALKKIKKRG